MGKNQSKTLSKLVKEARQGGRDQGSVHSKNIISNGLLISLSTQCFDVPCTVWESWNSINCLYTIERVPYYGGFLVMEISCLLVQGTCAESMARPCFN